MRSYALAILFSAAAHQVAADPVLGFPVDCDLGETCFIQQYVDRDPTSGARDFTCSGLSYDGHKGTDIRVPDFADLAADVMILAAAPGTVRGVRDGMEDGPLTAAKRAALSGKECGNGVVIDHGGGWETQYCHLKRGSVQVETGRRVAKGTPLGAMGQSGLAEFPHLHLSIRKDGAVVDPFSVGDVETCGVAGPTLWETPVPYMAGGILEAGFSDAIPDFEDIKAGTADTSTLPATAPALVVWGFVFGTKAGDEMRLSIEGPNGRSVHENTVQMDRAQAQAFRASGRRLRAQQWRDGAYTGRVSLWRNGKMISEQITHVTLIR